jgi:CheY-like chemotaxis protein
MHSTSSLAATGIGPTISAQVSQFVLSRNQTLLWVDDSRTLLSLYKSVFEDLGFAVCATSSPREALHHASADKTDSAIDVAILDYEMPEMNGGELAHLLRFQHPTLPIILYSSSTCIPASVNDSVDAVCVKGAPRQELLATIEWLSGNPSRTTCEYPSVSTPSSNH